MSKHAPTAPTKPGALTGWFKYLVVAALMVIPLIYAGTLIWANNDPVGSIDQVPAAIINEDRGASTAAADGSSERVVLGDEVVEALTDPGKDAGFNWSVVDRKTAEAGLADGDYLALLTVPADFSQQAVSSLAATGDDLEGATQATLSIRTDDSVSYLVGTIAQTVGTKVTDQLSNGVNAKYLTGLALGFGEVHSSVLEASRGAGQLAAGTKKLSDGTLAAATGSSELADGASSAAAGANTLANGLNELNAKVSQLPASTQQLADGGAAAAQGAKALADGIDQAVEQVTRFADGAQHVIDDASGTRDAAKQLIENWPNLSDEQRLAALTAIANDLEAAANSVDPAEVQAMLDAAAHAREQVTGELQPGARQLSDGLNQLSAGLNQLNQQSGVLASSVNQAAGGANTLAGGLSQLEDGATRLSQGASELNSGARTLDGGAQKLSQALTSGADKVPNFTKQQADTLGDLASSPVQLDAEREHAVNSNGAGLTPYFLALGLWIGAFACFMMLPAVPEQVLRGPRPAPIAALRAMSRYALLAIAQSVFAVIAAHSLIGIDMADLGGVFGLAMLTSVTFMVLNQMLIALLGAPGRFVALLLVVFQLASAGGTYPVQTLPEPLQRLHELLPLSYAVQGFRALISGGSGLEGGVPVAVSTLLGWLIGSAVLLTAAIWVQRRRLSPAPVTSVPAASAA